MQGVWGLQMMLLWDYRMEFSRVLPAGIPDRFTLGTNVPYFLYIAVSTRFPQ
jgi:hypothetical protein